MIIDMNTISSYTSSVQVVAAECGQRTCKHQKRTVEEVVVRIVSVLFGSAHAQPSVFVRLHGSATFGSVEPLPGLKVKEGLILSCCLHWTRQKAAGGAACCCR